MMLKRLFNWAETRPHQVELTENDAFVAVEPPVPREEHEPRNKQKNIKTTASAITAFRLCARTLSMTESELFEDMVAGLYERLKAEGRLTQQ